MDDLEAQIEREVARQLARDAARRQARAEIERSRRARYQAKLDARDSARAEIQAQRDHRCGARTRTGAPCKRRGTGAGGRCPNHGGLSTGPRTKAGRKRIAQAQRQRWAEQRTQT
jgi:hypothetical protein